MSTQKDERVNIRRKDRLVQDESWIKDVLRYEPYCTVATSVNDQPFCTTVSFLLR